MAIRERQEEDPRALPDDAELLRRIADKNRGAFETLYRRYYRRMFHFVLKLVKADGIAEETVDDVMFAVWKSAGSFQARSTVSTWLFGIAYRQALKAIDRDRRNRDIAVDDNRLALEADEHPAANPEAAAIDREMSRLTQAGLDSLSEQHRAVVELTALGHSYGEISEVTGCCANTVKTRMFYARRQLKRFMAQNGASLVPNGKNTDEKKLSKRL